MTRSLTLCPPLRPLPTESAAGVPRFTLQELSGGMGDIGTFLPLAVALSVSVGMDLGLILISAGLMNLVTGWFFNQPIPVQPMKAIAVAAIAEALAPGQVAAAGLLSAAVLFVLACTGLVGWANRLVPKSLIRGLQVGIGVKLVFSGLQWVWALPMAGWNSWLVAALATGLLLLPLRRQPVLLYLFASGFVLLGLAHPHAFASIAPHWPHFHWVWPGADDWWPGLVSGALPQLPLTLLNSVVAVCSLSADYFPGRGIPPRRMALSVAAMNLVCVPLGGMPVCHGSGGLAAQYRFGARTGGSVILLGLLKIAAGLLIGAALLDVLRLYPKSILGVMVILAGLTLAAAVRDLPRRAGDIGVMAVTVAGIALANTFCGFLSGAAFVLLWRLAKTLRANRQPDTGVHPRRPQRVPRLVFR